MSWNPSSIPLSSPTKPPREEEDDPQTVQRQSPRQRTKKQSQTRHETKGMTWKDTPKFLDATASVAASTFGGRRLPELQSLYTRLQRQDHDRPSHFNPEQSLLSGGGKRSNRHLRRRTTAVESKKHYHRYPRGGHRVVESSKESPLGNQTTDANIKHMEFEGKSRKSRRKKHSLLTKSHEGWLQTNGNTNESCNETIMNQKPSSNSAFTESPATKWLITHLWHAKRFHMATLWDGWRVPLAHTNRGSRAVLRLSQEQHHDYPQRRYIMMRDISWERQPLCIQATNIRREENLARLLQVLQRVCPDLTTVTPNLNKAFLCGCVAKECVLYGLDQFPSGAIGPVWWRMYVAENGNDVHKSNLPQGRDWIVEVRHHPSIRIQVRRTLQNLIEDCSEGSFVLSWCDVALHSPRICFRLYGSASTLLVDSIILEDENDERELTQWKWNDIVGSIGDEKNMRSPDIPNGAVVIIPVKRILAKKQVNVATNNGTARTGHVSTTDKREKGYQSMVLDSISGYDLFGDNARGKLMPHRENKLMLVYQAPRPLDCSANRAMSGWEIYCNDAQMAKDLWMVMSTFDQSQARASASPQMDQDYPSTVCCCAIGLIEESQMRLDCEPPLPVFPRDHVDTEVAHLYWNEATGSSEESTNGDNLLIWRYIRQLHEGGWARLPLEKNWSKIQVSCIEFITLVKDPQSNSDMDVEHSQSIKSTIVVRNAFIAPFVSVIQSCCGYRDSEPVKDNEKEAMSHRRKRRKCRPWNQAKFAPTLSRNQREAFRSMCQELSSSLSLPAVLLCHLRIIDKGTMKTGDDIVISSNYLSSNAKSEDTEDDSVAVILGKVTCGAFSMSRGAHHGMGVVGAARLLEYLTICATTSKGQIECGRIAQNSNGRCSSQLFVQIRNPLSSLINTHACLSLVVDHHH